MLKPNLKILFYWTVFLVLMFGCGSGGNDKDDTTATLSLSCEPSMVDYYGTVTLSWKSTEVDSCEASEAWSGPKETTGNEKIGPITESSSFTLTCKGLGGEVAKTAAVTVRPENAPTVELTAKPTSAKKDVDKVILSWTSTNANTCEATKGTSSWAGTKETSGDQDIGTLSADTEFDLTCTGPDGSAKASATVTVFVGDEPTVDLSSDRAWVHPGETINLSWTSTNTTGGEATDGTEGWPGTKDPEGKDQEFGPLTQTTTFTLRCFGDEGDAEDSVGITYVPRGKGSALLEWEPPMKGDEPEVFDGYRFEYGTASGKRDKFFEDGNTAMTTYLIEDLDSGEWFFVLKAYRNTGSGPVYSKESNEASGLIMPSAKTLIGVQK